MAEWSNADMDSDSKHLQRLNKSKRRGQANGPTDPQHSVVSSLPTHIFEDRQVHTMGPTVGSPCDTIHISTKQVCETYENVYKDKQR